MLQLFRAPFQSQHLACSCRRSCPSKLTIVTPLWLNLLSFYGSITELNFLNANKTSQIHVPRKTNSYQSALVGSSICFQLARQFKIYYKLLKFSKICDKTGNQEMFSLSRALEILSQYLVLRTDILKKTVVECTCFNGKTPYCQNSIINVLKPQ